MLHCIGRICAWNGGYILVVVLHQAIDLHFREDYAPKTLITLTFDLVTTKLLC